MNTTPAPLLDPEDVADYGDPLLLQALLGLELAASAADEFLDHRDHRKDTGPAMEDAAGVLFCARLIRDVIASMAAPCSPCVVSDALARLRKIGTARVNHLAAFREMQEQPLVVAG